MLWGCLAPSWERDSPATGGALAMPAEVPLMHWARREGRARAVRVREAAMPRPRGEMVRGGWGMAGPWNDLPTGRNDLARGRREGEGEWKKVKRVGLKDIVGGGEGRWGGDGN